MYSERHNDTILFSREGGVDIGNVEEKSSKMQVNYSYNNASVVAFPLKKEIHRIVGITEI